MFNLHPQLSADTLTIGDLPLCRLLLVNDSQFPWVILVPRRNGIKEIYQLNSHDQQQLQTESNTVSELIMGHFNGDKLNIATLGNLVPQLHIHHIVRYTTDPLWPKPIWGAMTAKPYQENAAQRLVEKLHALISLKLSIKKP